VAGAVPGSPGEAYLRTHRVRTRLFESLDAALQELAARRVDAVLGPEIELRALLKERAEPRIDVVTVAGERQTFAFALPERSQSREALDRALLTVRESPRFREIEFRYLGI
jgi:ABC-type amino acid transport substrate-binding protein